MNNSLHRDPYLGTIPVLAGYKVIGPVVLYQKLGSGGMAAVYRGWHLRFFTDVAVKILSASLDSISDEAAKRFLREAAVAVKLNHPNIVRCFDVNVEYGLHYIILEFIDGMTAQERLRLYGHPGLTESEVIALLAPAASALAEAHAANIVHRDIKPHNIMLDTRGRVVLMDLGLAKSIDDSRQDITLTSDLIGTPHYMPPEMWRNCKNITTHADTWQFGVTMYKLATGRLPWKSSGRGASMYAEQARMVTRMPMPDPREFVPELSDELLELLKACLRKSPEERIPADQLEARMAEIVADRKLQPVKADTFHMERAETPPPEIIEEIAGKIFEENTVTLYPETANTDSIKLRTGTAKIPEQIRDNLKKIANRYAGIPNTKILRGVAAVFSRELETIIAPDQVRRWLKSLQAESNTERVEKSRRIEQTLEMISSGIIEEWAEMVGGEAEEYEIEAEILAWKKRYPALDETMVRNHIRKCLEVEAKKAEEKNKTSSARIWLESQGITVPTGEPSTLSSLVIDNPHVTNLKPLKNISHLRELTISGLKISDISPLAEMRGLKTLVIADCENLSDISPLASLNLLTHLRLNRLPVFDISPLQGLLMLEEIDLSGSLAGDIRSLEGLPDLSRVNLEDCSNVPPEIRADWNGPRAIRELFEKNRRL